MASLDPVIHHQVALVISAINPHNCHSFSHTQDIASPNFFIGPILNISPTRCKDFPKLSKLYFSATTAATATQIIAIIGAAATHNVVSPAVSNPVATVRNQKAVESTQLAIATTH